MHYRSLLASLLLFSLPACTTDAQGDTDTDTDSGDSSGSTSGPTTGVGPTSAPSSTSGSSGAQETGSSSSDPSGTDEGTSTGSADESSSGGLEPNICYGYSFLGSAGQVFSDGTAQGEPTCTTTPAPCGGEVVGTWNADAACGYEALPNFFEDICAGATQQITGATLTGTRTFNEDGTYVFNGTTQLEVDLQVDSEACTGLECVAFGEALSNEPGLEMVCEPAAKGDGCDCIYTTDLEETAAGTWDLFGGGLLLTDDEGETQGVFDYCVDAGRFSMWLPLYQGTAFPEFSCSEDEDCEGQVEGSFDGVGCDEPEEDER
ncbi:MAG: hypothetical protein KUG77_20930 [Nannocystaceae bacterium]|nr:hypothetical protein [Nannocystaceae bacterium]